MRGTRAKMIRKSVAHFPKEELKVTFFKRYSSKNNTTPITLPETFRYSADSFQRNYKDAKRAAA